MSQKPQELLVTLTNGTQVPWSVFRSWSAAKQASLVMSAEARNRIREAARATHTNRNWSDTHRARHREAMDAKVGQPSANAGKKLTEEHRAKLKGRERSDQHRAHLSAALVGKTPSAETRAKQRQAALNREGAGNNAKRIHTPFGVFDSAKIAAEKLGVAYCTIGRRTVKDPANYYFL